MHHKRVLSHQPAAVLIFSLLSMGIITILTQQLMKSVSVGTVFSRSMVAREQAEMLVYGGLSIAAAQLEKCYVQSKKKEDAPATQFSFKAFISDVLPSLHRWQHFALVEAYDGINATINVCIVPEEGKLPLSLLFDEPKRDLSAQGKNIFKQWALGKKSPAGDFGNKLAAFLKQRTQRLSDVSLLLPLAKQLRVALWYEPAVLPQSKKEKGGPAACALQDMCTLWGGAQSMNPLLFSTAVCTVFGLRQPLPQDATVRKDQYKQLAENYEKIKGLKGEEMWKALSALYDAKPKLSADVNALFSLEVEPRFYSVLSCATVAGVTQKVLAIMEREVPPVPQVQNKGQEQKKKNEQPRFVMRRLYWL